MTDQPEYTGGKTNYYMVDVISPVDQRSDPYTAECQDIIEALGMDFNEGNAFKALWRRAAARLGKSKRGYTDGLYDAEKVEFYGKRLVELERRGRAAVTDPERPPKRWEVGTLLRRTHASSEFFTLNKEYEIIELSGGSILHMIDDRGRRHSWTEAEARKRFVRA